MKSKNNYISAFTIFEMAVTMVITAIILMIVYQIFSVAQQQLSTYIRMQDDVISYEQFTTQFSVDVQGARAIKRLSDSSIQLLVNEDEITYAFAKAYTLRKTTVQDTLPITITSMQLDTLSSQGERNLIIRLQGDLLGNPIEIYEAKRLDLSTQINIQFL